MIQFIDQHTLFQCLHWKHLRVVGSYNENQLGHEKKSALQKYVLPLQCTTWSDCVAQPKQTGYLKLLSRINNWLAQQQTLRGLSENKYSISCISGQRLALRQSKLMLRVTDVSTSHLQSKEMSYSPEKGKPTMTQFPLSVKRWKLSHFCDSKLSLYQRKRMLVSICTQLN